MYKKNTLTYSFILTILVLFLVNTTAQKPLNSNHSTHDSIVKFAESFVGKPYLYGGCTQKGFDCSGFVYFVYKCFDIEVPRSSADYWTFGNEVAAENCQKGDIILFTGTNYDHSVVGHVGIIISNQGEPIRFIHSSSSKKHRGVTITDYASSSYPKRYMGIRRVS